MATPTAATVRNAFIAYAATEDEECALHPERVVATLPRAEALARQQRLLAVEQFNVEAEFENPNPARRRPTLS